MEFKTFLISNFLIIVCFIIRIQCVFFVQEENRVHRFVGNVLESDTLPSRIDKNNITGLKCSLLTGGNPLSNYFTIIQTTGEILAKESLDRESICGPDTVVCLVVLDVAISTDTLPTDIFRVDIEIEDVNDNAPVFSETELYLIIPEDAFIDSEFPIPTAHDLDIGENSAITYYLDPISDVFGIATVKSLDGASGAAILLQQNLDRESVSFYKLRILAKDGGVPQQTGTMFLTINISDVNDNRPVMAQLAMDVILPETIPVGTLVFTTTATDGDSGINSQVRYRLHPRTASVTAGLFGINSTTGDIHLLSNLDFEKRTNYKLIVESFDAGIPSLTSQALVNVTVADVNDNAPVVNVNYISGKTYAVVSEDVAVNTFVAYISVTDVDSGLNAISDCHFEHDQFKIEKLRENEFQVVTLSALDREAKSEYYLQLTCQDRGDPTMGASGILHVKVTDENDNAPNFQQNTFPVMVQENLGIGKPVIELSAIDIDEGINSLIRYEIVSDEPESSLFHINPETGTILVAHPLDRESLSAVLLVVTATDNGIVPRRNRAIVNITILDVNDEFPVFSRDEYPFYVRENVQTEVIVGNVKALDADQGINGQVKYSILHDDIRSIFSIDEISGVIQTSFPFDRELSPLIIFHVRASDMGEPALTSTTTVIITIIDMNDNSPSFVFPTNNNNTAVFTFKEKSILVAKVCAIDADFNSVLTYSIIGFTNLFFMNRSSGEIFLSRDLNLEEDGSDFTLNISVSDGGMPVMSTNATLELVLVNSKDITTSKDFNMYIVAIVIALTIVIAAVIIGVIVVIRKHDAESKNGRENKGTNSQKPKRVSVTVRHDNQTFNEPWDEGGEKTMKTEVTLNNQRQAVKESQKNRRNTEDTVCHSNLLESSGPNRKPHKTWLTDLSSTEISEKLPDSMSDISERTFDSGKGGSDRSERFRGSNSTRPGAYTCNNYNRGEPITGYHPKGEVFTKNADSSWEVQGRFCPAILSDDSQSGIHGTPVWCSTPECYSPGENGSWIREEIQSDTSTRGRIRSEESYPSSPQYLDSQTAHSVFV